MVDNNVEAVAAPEKVAAGRPVTHWRSRFFLLGLLGLAAVGWFLPAIMGQAWSHSDVLELLGPDLPATIQFDRASLSWQSPVLLRDVKVADRQGRASASIRAVTTGQTLWQLVSNRMQPLTLEFEGLASEVVMPTMHLSPQTLSLGDPKVQIEHALNLLLTRKIPRLPRGTSIHFTGSRLTFVDKKRRVLTVLDDISGTYVYRPGGTEGPAAHRLDVQGQVQQPATQGHVQIQGEWQAPGGQFSQVDETLPFTEQDEKFLATIQLDRWPLDPLQPLTFSAFGGQLITGAVTGNAVLAVSRHPQGGIHSVARGELHRPSEPQLELVPVLQQGDGKAVPFDLDPLTWNLQANYSRDQDMLNVPQLAFSSVPLSVQGEGRIEGVSQAAVVDVTGQLRCDAQAIFDQLPQELRNQMQVRGLRVAEFTARGPLRSLTSSEEPLATQAPSPDAAFRVATVLAWDEVKAYGLVSEQGKVRASVDEGVLTLEPVQFPVNQGHVRQLPRILLNSEPIQFQLAQGVLLERVALTESVVRSWLKYVSPAMANATTVAGQVSVSAVQPVTASFSHLETADIPGVLTIHQAKIGPGPVLQQILMAVDQIRLVVDGRNALPGNVTVSVTDQQVAFRLFEGRVYHKDFGLDIGDVRVSTTGSVGLDETLDIALSIPLNEKWLQRGPVMQSLQGEVIVLNIRGTLDQPQLDLRPLGEFGKRIGIKAAGGLLQRLLDGKRLRDR